MELLEAYSKVVRAEYLKGELPAVLVPALLTVTTFEGMAAINVLESVIVFSLLYVTGFMINAVTDREIDLTYGSFKQGVGQAASALGDRRILTLIFIQLAVGLVLAIDLSIRLANPMLVVLVLIGVFFGLAYSAPPFSLKTRGVVAHAVSLALSAFTVPFLFLYIAARGTLDVPGLLVVGSFSVTGYSLEYANQAYDFTEDQAAGLETPVVRLGLRRSLYLAFATFAISLPLLAFSLVYLGTSRPSVTLALGDAARPLIALAAIAAVGAGFYIPLRGMARIVRTARSEDHDSPELVEHIRGECNYALWQSAGVSGLAAFGVVIFLLTSSTTYSLEAAAQAGFAFDDSAGAVSNSGLAGPEADVTASIHASPGTEEIPRGGLVRVELFAGAESRPYATTLIPVTLPRPGEQVDFSARGLSLRSGTTTTAHLTLLVDADFDGRATAGSAQTQVTMTPTP